MKVRTAYPDEVELIVRWRQEAAEWIAERGHDQWSDVGLNDAAFRDRVKDSIASGETWMAVDNQLGPVGTIAVDDHTDTGLWSTEERDSAVIVHRMIVPRYAAGRGVGALLLEQAEQVAEQRGRMYIRLDAWTSNRDLHAYYQRAGFRHVRTASDHHTPSAALFEKRVYAVRMPPCPPLSGRCDP